MTRHLVLRPRYIYSSLVTGVANSRETAISSNCTRKELTDRACTYVQYILCHTPKIDIWPNSSVCCRFLLLLTKILPTHLLFLILPLILLVITKILIRQFLFRILLLTLLVVIKAKLAESKQYANEEGYW